MTANRWLHLRHPQGFSEELLERFQAGCRIWRAYVEALLTDWRYTPNAGSAAAPRFVICDPELSADRRVATLPLGGEQTLGSRARIENQSCFLLRAYLPSEFKCDLEEGLTEDDLAGRRVTNWRKPVVPLSVWKDGEQYVEAFGPIEE